MPHFKNTKALIVFSIALLAWQLTLSVYAQDQKTAGNTVGEPAIVVTTPELETLPPSPRDHARQQFLADNPGARVHELNLPMNASDEAEAAPALVLERMIVGSNGTLVEIRGLPTAARRVSAVMNFNSLKITNDKGASAVLGSVQGAEQLRDKRGQQAILVRPNVSIQLLFFAMDDTRPMKIEHLNERGMPFVYFEKIDPRFKERYNTAYAKTQPSDASPEDLKDFLVEFAKNDPDGKSKEVFLKLINAMRAQNTFEGFYNAYLLIQEPIDGNRAWALAKTNEQKAKVEHIAITALVDKNRLIDFDFQLRETKPTGGEESNSGMFGATFSFLMGKDAIRRASKEIAGVLTASLKPDRPIPLVYGNYRFRFALTAVVPRFQSAQGFTVTPTGTFDVVLKNSTNLQLSSGSTRATTNVSVGRMDIAYLDRGMAGGYTARYVSSDGKVEVKLLGVDIIETLPSTQSNSAAPKPINFQDLSRSGFSATKNIVITGLKRDADQWFSSFGADDSSERRTTQASVDKHRSENNSCNKDGNCFSVVSQKSKEIVVRCQAGFDKGHTKYIRVDSGGYDCNTFIVTSCEKTLRAAAIRSCGLSN